MFLGEHFFQANCLFRHKIFTRVGGFDETMRICEDLDLYIRFLLTGYFPHYLPGPLYLHRFHEMNLSKVTKRENNPNAHLKDVANLYERYAIKLKKILIRKQIEKIKNHLSDANF